MMELIDEKTKKRLDTISECFDLEDYFKKIESKSKDIYYQTVALVITKDKLIARSDFCLHVNAATEIYKREFPNFKKFTDEYKVVGFDNSPISREAIIPISTIGQQIDTIAYEAVSLLVEQMNERKKRRPNIPDQPIHKIITPILLRRETTEGSLSFENV